VQVTKIISLLETYITKEQFYFGGTGKEIMLKCGYILAKRRNQKQ